MFDTDTFTAPISALDDLRIFVDEHTDGLLDAAALLGGQPGVRLARSVLDGLGCFGTPSRGTMRALDDLLDLLMLEHVHDPDRIEATRFAMINPASPVVEEICLLADGLKDAVASYRNASATFTAPVGQQVAA